MLALEELDTPKGDLNVVLRIEGSHVLWVFIAHLQPDVVISEADDVPLEIAHVGLAIVRVDVLDHPQLESVKKGDFDQSLILAIVVDQLTLFIFDKEFAASTVIIDDFLVLKIIQQVKIDGNVSLRDDFVLLERLHRAIPAYCHQASARIVCNVRDGPVKPFVLAPQLLVLGFDQVLRRGHIWSDNVVQKL